MKVKKGSPFEKVGVQANMDHWFRWKYLNFWVSRELGAMKLEFLGCGNGGYCIQRAFWWGEGWKGSMVKRRGLVVRASMWPTATGKGTHRRQSESKGEARDNWNACPTYWLTDSLLALHHPSLTQFPFPIPCTKATPEPMWQPLFPSPLCLSYALAYY